MATLATPVSLAWRLDGGLQIATFVHYTSGCNEKLFLPFHAVFLGGIKPCGGKVTSILFL
jgi:hypothetical protein